jgi:integrase
MSDSGKSVGTIRGAHNMMSQVMIEAVRSGLIDSNPCAHTRFPRMARYEPNIITPEEANILMNAMPERYYTFVAVLAYCGLRFGEAAALKRGRVHLDRKEIDIVESVTNAGGQTVWGETKTYEKRTVSLPSFLVTALANHMDEFSESGENSLVFTASGGGWIQNNNFHNRVWRPTIKRLVKEGILQTHVMPKDLRATCGSWVAATDGVLEAAKRLGHSNTATTTKHYARPIAGRDIKVANHLDEQFQTTLNENRVAS